MKIKLNRLQIENFKGVKALSLDFQGKNAVIRGKNATGKSSIGDAWYWLISGKDSDMQAGFNIIPLSADGLPVDHINPTVEAELMVGKKKVTLKKEYKQKWTKKRGSAEREFTGHTTDYWFNGVPVGSLKEYSDKLAEIIDDTLFRILSDVRFFCAGTKMEFRRAMLLEICGAISDNDIIAKNPELAELDSILSEHEIEERRKIIAAAKKQINKQLEYIPERIDELKKQMPDVSGHDEIAIRQQVADYEERIATEIKELGALASGLNINELRKKIADRHRQLAILDTETMQSNRKKNDDLQSELSIEKKLLVGSEMELEKETLKINALEQTMLNNEAMRTDLMKQWQTENDRELPLAGTCHTCGQLLPEKMIFEQTDNFRREKAENLRKINTQGSNLHADYVKMQAKKQVIAEHIAKIESTIKKEKSEVERIEKAIHKINNENNKEYGKKQAEISTEIKGLEDKIEEMQGSIAPEKERLKTSISTLEDEKSVLDSKLLELTHAEKNRARIRELEAERKTAAQEYENFERETFLMDSFVKKKAEWIEQHVSNHFAITRWKLFDVQVNKGVRDICEPMLEGVPYSTDLNNGSKILCGLDCINAISKHKKISVPVFIDNAESLTDWLDFPHQHIRLIVDEKEKELKVSYD